MFQKNKEIKLYSLYAYFGVKLLILAGLFPDVFVHQQLKDKRFVNTFVV